MELNALCKRHQVFVIADKSWRGVVHAGLMNRIVTRYDGMLKKHMWGVVPLSFNIVFERSVCETRSVNSLCNRNVVYGSCCGSHFWFQFSEIWSTLWERIVLLVLMCRDMLSTNRVVIKNYLSTPADVARRLLEGLGAAAWCFAILLFWRYSCMYTFIFILQELGVLDRWLGSFYMALQKKSPNGLSILRLRISC